MRILRKAVRAIISLIGILLWVVGMAGIPEDVQRWAEWLQSAGDIVDHQTGRWLLAGGGVAIVVLANVPWRRLKQTRNIAPAKPSAGPQLKIEYDRRKHYTRHPNGTVEVKFTVRNVGTALAKRVRIKLDHLLPAKRVTKAAPYSTQFTCATLKVVRCELGFSIQPSEPVEVRLVSATKNGGDFLFDGYDIHNQPGIFKTLASEYEVQVIATSHDGGADTRQFRIWKNRNGELDAELVAG